MKPLFDLILAPPRLVLICLLILPGISALHAGGPTSTGSVFEGTLTEVGYSGLGTLQFNAGNTLVTSTDALVGVNAGNTGLVNVDGAGALWTITNGAWIGNYGSGTLNIAQGGTVIVNSKTDGTGNPLSVAYGTGTTGTVTVMGAGSTLSTAGSVELGAYGAATLSISKGGVVNTTIGSSNPPAYQGIELAYYAGSSATVTVDGAGSQWNITNDGFGNLGGTATITVSNGGQINSEGISLATGQGSGATTASTMTITGVDPNTGAAATVNAGSLTVFSLYSPYPTIRVTNGGVLNSTASIVGQEGSTSPGTGSVTVDGINANGKVSQWNVVGSLILGNAGSTGSVTLTNGGELNIYTSTTSEQTGIGDGTLTLGGTPTGSLPSPSSTGTLYIGTGGGAGVINAAEIVGFTGANASSAISTLIFNDSSTGYVLQNAGGTGIVVAGSTQIKNLAGVNILTAASTYSGGTLITGGTLAIDNTTGSGTGTGNVVVGSGGTLSGTGLIRPGGANSVSISGTLAPGGIGTIGKLTIDSGGSTASHIVSFLANATLQFNLGADNTSANLTVLNAPTGGLLFSDTLLNLVDLTGGNLNNGIYVLVTASSSSDYSGLTVNGTNQIINGLSIGTGINGKNAVLSLVNGNIDLTLTQTAPEPSTWVSLSLGMAALFLLNRYRRSASQRGLR